MSAELNHAEADGTRICGGDDLEAASDYDALQAVVVAAAVNDNSQVLARLPGLVSAFEEPYRTVVAIINARQSAGEFIDWTVLRFRLAQQRLHRQANGHQQPLTVTEVLNLISTPHIQPGQAEAYLDLLEQENKKRQRIELKDRLLSLTREHGSQPAVLIAQIEKLIALGSDSENAKYPSELMETIPYVQSLVERQCGNDFLGLDSGFPHLNNLCNGLDTGLFVLAAKPGRGKTTLAWQIACQVAHTQVPVIFVSLEQSKDELRAKALARLSKLQYRHILRGRLQKTDSADLGRLLDAALAYALLGRYLTVIEGDEGTTIDVIQKIAKAKLVESGAPRCLIIVDYLQVLPLNVEDAQRATSTKDRMDLHVSALRRLARRLKSPVLAISAVNRAGYSSKKLDVFKESGGIEYSADVAGILSRDKRHTPGQMDEFIALDLNIVKNRNGERGVVKFKFYAKRAEFVETGKDVLPEEAEDDPKS